MYIYMEDKDINGLIIVEKKRIFNSTVIQRNCVFTHIEDQWKYFSCFPGWKNAFYEATMILHDNFIR